jgi:hypothetical protein
VGFELLALSLFGVGKGTVELISNFVMMGNWQRPDLVRYRSQPLGRAVLRQVLRVPYGQEGDLH